MSKIKEVKLPCVTQNCSLTVASFRTWRGWAMLCCAGLDPKDINNALTPLPISIQLKEFHREIFHTIHFNNPSLSGADQDRTDDLFVANEALSQLSYSPRIVFKLRNNF
jgi:hypothetical protein